MRGGTTAGMCPWCAPRRHDYLIGSRNGKQGIIDVFFDNASETSRRLSEFKSIYYNSGYDALISSLEKKTNEMATRVGSSGANGNSQTN